MADRGTGQDLFFGNVLGQKSADRSAVAIARIKYSRCSLIIGITAATMSGSSHTDSYNSTAGSYSVHSAENKGHVCSNGDITIGGSTAINGNAHPGVGKQVKSSSSVGVMGQIKPLTKPLSFPPVDPGNAATVNNNAKIPLSTYKKQAVNNKNEFSFSGGDSVVLPPGRHYFNKMTLSGSSSISITGATEIYVNGDVSLRGGSVTNQTQLPKNLQLFPMGNKAVISGTSDFYGVVYAPTAKVERSGDSDYFGAIIGGQLALSGSGGVHADESLDSSYLSGGRNRAILTQ